MSLDLTLQNSVDPGSNSKNIIVPKECFRCHHKIVHDPHKAKSTLKALGKYYHETCFTCHDCAVPLKPKFFPYQENSSDEPILLCQYHYFKRHALLCKVCDKPLRGLYYTAFGGRYDEEHFSCVICHAPCGVKKCFIFEDNLYCKYHFLKYFSKRCKGCDYPISDKYIEFPKGDEVHCWHPECYGIHKYWHVNLSPEKLALPRFTQSKYDPKLPYTDINPTSAELDKQMQAFAAILTKTWVVLYRFEEETASCISDMLQYLTSFDQMKGIEATALFVLKIECLFSGLDHLPAFNILTKLQDGSKNDKLRQTDTEYNDSKTKYLSLTRNLTTKVMIYLQLLRKLNTVSSKKSIMSSFMSVITGLANFLKFLTRYGFYESLEDNQRSHYTSSLTKFLIEVERNELYTKNPFSEIDIPVTATDACSGCSKYIQEECIQFQEHRWHLECFTCASCTKTIGLVDLNDSNFNKRLKTVLCFNCSLKDPESVPGFKLVTRLSQLIYLLKIALVRSRVVMKAQLKNTKTNTPNVINGGTTSVQQTYIRTLNDIKRLRSKRESVRLTKNNKQEARKSLVVNTGEEEVDKTLTENPNRLIIETEKVSSTIAEEEGQEEVRASHDNVFNNTKSLTLDDISRIVAAEQARELRPNAFTHFKKLQEGDDEVVSVTQKRSGVYYSELNDDELRTLWIISATLLVENGYAPATATTTLLPTLLPRRPKANSLSSSSSSGNFWNQMRYAMGMKSKKTVPKKVFGTSIDILTDRWGVDSDLGVGPKKVKIPIIVDELISSLHQMDMSVEGIFRKNGNIKRLVELATSIDENPMEIPDLSKENCIQLSALLKKFFRELPDPLLADPLYDVWISAAKLNSEMESEKVISLAYSLLPQYNRNVMEVILSFLYWASSFSHIENEMGSKMDIHNLSTVITPNILYSRRDRDRELNTNLTEAYSAGFAENEGQHHFLAIEVVDFLITHNEEMAIIPRYLYNLIQEVKGSQLIEDEKIREFITKKVKQGQIDYSEFNRQNSVTMKTSTTRVVQTEVNKR
ncbi:GTPase-activating protein LRG1 KNAG_0E02960 [Huiozyma naganishii CBS 8797]|uniref:Rho-GAP domain-containing protein n=1 Tax=Huiozyma naganishii (strain ATCC MYA-139 / BCRC 22969 / CBS 8797 / KCTC 17520 / NBRC 10181 / NCYC 3082 / Yp74L-3) TaxID=1071383 RepID=J7R6S9_HUIN7|nr:hypothetical protein KNAG_0E02960 [Kazachstania naganishii CBS 8797]CCK70555.1 hypothetical protein KNAG_0E02960 [Kazachstania naganishii CBS 8797]